MSLELYILAQGTLTAPTDRFLLDISIQGYAGHNISGGPTTFLLKSDTGSILLGDGDIGNDQRSDLKRTIRSLEKLAAQECIDLKTLLEKSNFLITHGHPDHVSTITEIMHEFVPSHDYKAYVSASDKLLHYELGLGQDPWQAKHYWDFYGLPRTAGLQAHLLKIGKQHETQLITDDSEALVPLRLDGKGNSARVYSGHEFGQLALKLPAVTELRDLTNDQKYCVSGITVAGDIIVSLSHLNNLIAAYENVPKIAESVYLEHPALGTAIKGDKYTAFNRYVDFLESPALQYRMGIVRYFELVSMLDLLDFAGTTSLLLGHTTLVHPNKWIRFTTEISRSDYIGTAIYNLQTRHPVIAERFADDEFLLGHLILAEQMKKYAA